MPATSEEACVEELEARTEQRSIQSIEVGFRLIRALEEAGGKMPLKALAAKAGMAPGKAHVYAVSFLRLGLIVQDPATGHYGLGPYAIQLGQAALRQVNIAEVGRAHLDALHQRFQLPTYISIWGRMGPFIIIKNDGDLPTPVSIRVGFVFPVLTTATGAIFLAYSPDAVTREVVAKEGSLHRDLLERLTEVRARVLEQGFAASGGHLFRGFSAIAAPVFDHEGGLAGAVTMLGIATFMDPKPGSAMVTAVQETAALIGAQLGAPKRP
jgi:DNA-binding IclR family transcriptional regulator